MAVAWSALERVAERVAERLAHVCLRCMPEKKPLELTLEAPSL